MVYYIYVIHKCTVGLETCMPYGQLVDSQLSLCAVHESMSKKSQTCNNTYHRLQYSLPTLSVPSECLKSCGAIANNDRDLVKRLGCFREGEDSDSAHQTGYCYIVCEAIPLKVDNIISRRSCKGPQKCEQPLSPNIEW